MSEFHVGDRVQVMNPGPMSVGTVVGDTEHEWPSGLDWVRVRFDDEDCDTWSRADLLAEVS